MTGPVTWVAPDKLGGVLTIVRSLLRARPDGGPGTSLVLTDNQLDIEPRGGTRRDADREVVVSHQLPRENLFAALRRLRRAIGTPGVLVSNDWIELAMEHAYPTGAPVVQLLHADHAYYYDLAVRHDTVIDAFIVYSRAMARRLHERLPHRRHDVHYLPYGITLPARLRTPSAGPLRLVFAGRLEHGQKGVLDLPAIDARLAARGVDVEWTIIGAGPDESRLRDAWRARPVRWTGALDHAVTLDRLHEFDLFVLPTRAEGLPVALIEAMGAGLVPVVSDIESGIPEVVDDGVTGYRVQVGDVEGYAAAIVGLATDRPRLERMSGAAAMAVRGRFDPVARGRAYYDMLGDLAGRPRPARRPTRVPYGSRLDRRWLPNALVRGVRTLRGRR